ncbi:MarR family winged helix-turn-helix transcriptional regulator [Streptomyces sp. T-3]|nr:MarR family winged helix-turn-helix transcriptional regulator [Streptomyces sp. T-3]
MNTDKELAAQPVAYWTDITHKEVIGFIRGQLAELGLSQPQYWLLRHLSAHDLSADGQGQTIDELRAALREYVQPGDEPVADAEVLCAHGWLLRDDDGRLWITEAGEAARQRVKAAVPRIRAAIHRGIDDADYATTVRVLRTMLANVRAEGIGA